MCVTMTSGGRLSFLALLCCEASCPSVSLAVPGAVGLVVTVALSGHPNSHKQSPVACERRKSIMLSYTNSVIIYNTNTDANILL